MINTIADFNSEFEVIRDLETRLGRLSWARSQAARWRSVALEVGGDPAAFRPAVSAAAVVVRQPAVEPSRMQSFHSTTPAQMGTFCLARRQTARLILFEHVVAT
ncbi:MAG: hypothetical protein ABSB14_03230 [Candidatus Sulfotelmatobacter sp.]|jgi:hypothetical protein